MAEVAEVMPTAEVQIKEEVAVTEEIVDEEPEIQGFDYEKARSEIKYDLFDHDDCVDYFNIVNTPTDRKYTNRDNFLIQELESVKTLTTVYGETVPHPMSFEIMSLDMMERETDDIDGNKRITRIIGGPSFVINGYLFPRDSLFATENNYSAYGGHIYHEYIYCPCCMFRVVQGLAADPEYVDLECNVDDDPHHVWKNSSLMNINSDVKFECLGYDSETCTYYLSAELVPYQTRLETSGEPIWPQLFCTWIDNYPLFNETNLTGK